MTNKGKGKKREEKPRNREKHAQGRGKPAESRKPQDSGKNGGSDRREKS